MRLVYAGQFDGEVFAHEFAQCYGRRVKRHSVLGARGVTDIFAVSARQESGVTLRIMCDATSVTGDIDRPLLPGMACSIGSVLPDCTRESRFRAGRHGEFAVFVTARNSESVPALLASEVLLSALDTAALGPDEHVQTVLCPGFRFLRPDLERVMETFEALQRLQSAFHVPVRPSLPARFPTSLRPVSSVILEWGILNADARAGRIAEAHPEALQRLLGSARHYSAKIESFLSRTRFPNSEAAEVIRAFQSAVALAHARMDGIKPLWRAPRKGAGRHA